MNESTAILVEDEHALREELRNALAKLWPELKILGEASDGIAALSFINRLRPDIVFLDIRMPGLNGIEVAAVCRHAVHVVFLTAYDEHAISAFEHGAVDYLLKPLDIVRLAKTVQRLKEKIGSTPNDLSSIKTAQNKEVLRWIQASSGGQLRFINIADVRCFKADAKYTCVVTEKYEAHIRTPIKSLVEQLDNGKFWQISRSVIVNVAAIDAVKRINGSVMLRLHHDPSWLNVSSTFQHLFRQM